MRGGGWPMGVEPGMAAGDTAASLSSFRNGQSGTQGRYVSPQHPGAPPLWP